MVGERPCMPGSAGWEGWMFAPLQGAEYERDGCAVARGLFTPEEAAGLCDYYMELRARGSYPGDTAGVDAASSDPLKRFPRMIHMHRWDETSLRWLHLPQR